MRLPRWSVRTLMVVVAVAGLLVWGTLMGLRSYQYCRLAMTYGAYERQWRAMAARDRGMASERRSVAAVWGEPIADYDAPLARKYRRAMWRPWIPVAPDPPAPVFGAP